MSERTDDMKIAIMIGVTIAFIWKAVDFFSRIITEQIVNLWKNAPDHATEIVGFLIVFLVFVIAVLLYVLRGKD